MAATSTSPPVSKSSSQSSTTTTTTSTQAPNPSRSNSSSKQKPTLQPSASTFFFAPSWLTKSDSKQVAVPQKSGSPLPSPTTSSSTTGSPSNSTPSSSSTTMKRANGVPKPLKIDNPVQAPKRNPFLSSTTPTSLSNIPPSSSSSSRNSIDSPRLKPSTSSPSSPRSPTTSTASTKRSPPPSQNRSRNTKSTVASETKPASAFDANFPSLTAKPPDSTTPRSVWDDTSSRKEKVLSPSSSSSGSGSGTNIGLLESSDDPFANMEKGAEYGMKIEMLKQLVPKVSSSGSQQKSEEARGRRGRSRTRVGSLGNIMAPLGSTSTTATNNSNGNGNNNSGAGRSGGSGGGSAQGSVERKESAEGGDRSTLKRSLSSSASSSTNSLLKGGGSNSNNGSNSNRSSQSLGTSKLILKKGSITENDGEIGVVVPPNGRSLEEGINETLDTIRRVERERVEREKARAALSSKGEKDKIEKEKDNKGKEDMGAGKEKEKKEVLEERVEVPENWEDGVEDEENIRDDHRKETDLPATATTTAPSTTASSPTLSEASALTSNLGSRSASPSTSVNNSPQHSQRQVPNLPPGIPVSHISTPPLNNITEEPEDIEHDELSLPPTPPPEEKPFPGTASTTSNSTTFRESFPSRADSIISNNNNATNANNDVTETDKQRLLETVRNWTGGSRRWENNCAFGDRVSNSRMTVPSFNSYGGLVGVIGASPSRSPRISERRASEIYPSASMGGWNPLTGNMVYSYHQQPPPPPSASQGMNNFPQTLYDFPAPMRRGSTGGVYLENRSIGLGGGLHATRDFGGINGSGIYAPSIENPANNWIAVGGGGDLGRNSGMVGWGGSGYGNGGGVLRRGSEVGSFGW